MKSLGAALLFLTLSASPAFGQSAADDSQSTVPPGKSLGETTPRWEGQKDRELTYIGFYMSRAEYSNIFPSNELLKGQTVGRLFGTNSTTTSSEQKSWFTEQRFIPFFIYQPKILGGFALLRAAFQLDFSWGDTSYGTGGHTGGALSGGQVNLQTQNLEIEFRLNPRWYVDLGLQRLYDNPRDLYRTGFQTLALTGDRLAFWGTNASGVVVHGVEGAQKYKFGLYELYENSIQKDDDVALAEAAVDRYMGSTWHLGGSLRYVRDRANGGGGVTILGEGLNSALDDYNGTFRFPLGASPYKADIAWLSLETSVNPELASGRFGASAVAVANLGTVHTLVDGTEDEYEKKADIQGVFLNARAGYRYGFTGADRVTLEAIYSSGDSDSLDDGKYSGVITGNTWGAPAGVFTSHELYLLMPHIFVVNRYYGAVSDVSNIGYGLTAGVLSASRDLIPHKLALKVAGGAGFANAAPEGGGKTIGYELNGMLTYQPKTFFTLALHGAWLGLGDFYDSPLVVNAGDGTRPTNPWTVFTTLSWLMF